MISLRFKSGDAIIVLILNRISIKENNCFIVVKSLFEVGIVVFEVLEGDGVAEVLGPAHCRVSKRLFISLRICGHVYFDLDFRALRIVVFVFKIECEVLFLSELHKRRQSLRDGEVVDRRDCHKVSRSGDPVPGRVKLAGEVNFVPAF